MKITVEQFFDYIGQRPVENRLDYTLAELSYVLDRTPEEIEAEIAEFAVDHLKEGTIEKLSGVNDKGEKTYQISMLMMLLPTYVTDFIDDHQSYFHCLVTGEGEYPSYREIINSYKDQANFLEELKASLGGLIEPTGLGDEPIPGTTEN